MVFTLYYIANVFKPAYIFHSGKLCELYSKPLLYTVVYSSTIHSDLQNRALSTSRPLSVVIHSLANVGRVCASLSAHAALGRGHTPRHTHTHTHTHTHMHARTHTHTKNRCSHYLKRLCLICMYVGRHVK